MSKTLKGHNEMNAIYEAAKNVYEGKYSRKFAVSELSGKVNATESSLIMYFHVFSCMCKGVCYKMGTSETFTLFLLDNIFHDYGLNAYINALKAVKGNYSYRVSVNNGQPGLMRACKQSMADCGVSVNMDDLPLVDTSDSLPDGYTVTEKPIYLKPKVKIANSVSSFDTIELNIQPSASILNVFSRLSYKPWYAIAEFVDNSTQSYISNIEVLNELADFDRLVIVVKYNPITNTLRITDNAYGMELSNFKDAIILDSRNSQQTGRNEFGMGLKTAASWFGNVWSVTSSQLGSSNRYSATVDIPSLKSNGLNSVEIHRETAREEEHGTEILISDVTKKITGRTIGKIRDLLSSMYRRDINNRHIEVWFNDEPIVFAKYPILTNFRGKSWKKQLDFVVCFQGKQYIITGFVAIMNPGSFSKAGFALFRQDRVVIGGTDNNYKPTQIFGQAQSQRSLKLFGELNMNDFPVNQAKDGFIWDDGLEEAFVDALKENIQEYIEIAEMSIKERENEAQYSDEASKKLQREVEASICNVLIDDEPEETHTSEVTIEPMEENHKANKSSEEVQEYIDTVLNIRVPQGLVGSVREYNIPINSVSSIHFVVWWAIGNRDYWIEYSESAQDAVTVKINIDHPFFMPFSKDESFKRILEKFALAFILAEKQAKSTADREGYIPANLIRNNMNRYLKNMAEE
ncbi:MAG: ATP-binding protein [Christensenellaceae bacterium]